MLLMSSAGTSGSAADDLTAIIDISLQASNILIVDKCNFILTEMAYFSVSVSFKFGHFISSDKS